MHRVVRKRFDKWFRRYLTFKTPTPKSKCHFSSPCWNHWVESLAPNWLIYRGVSLILHTSLTSSIKARYIKALWHIIDTRRVQYLTSLWSQLLVAFLYSQSDNFLQWLKWIKEKTRFFSLSQIIHFSQISQNFSQLKADWNDLNLSRDAMFWFYVLSLFLLIHILFIIFALYFKMYKYKSF